jgi:hypothetical protein
MDGPLDRKDSVSIQRTESKKEIAALAGCCALHLHRGIIKNGSIDVISLSSTHDSIFGNLPIWKRMRRTNKRVGQKNGEGDPVITRPRRCIYTKREKVEKGCRDLHASARSYTLSKT